jgi:hypothetical protein
VVIDPDGRIERTHAGEFEREPLAATIDAMIGTWDERGTLDRRPVVHIPEVTTGPRHILSYPSKVVAADGGLYVADTGHHRVLHIRADLAEGRGEIVGVWGTGDAARRDGAGEQTAFHHPRGLALHGDTLYVADTDNHAIRAIDLQDGMVRTVAGDGTKAHGPIMPTVPTLTPLRSPWALVAMDDTVTIAMAGSHQLWELRNDHQLRLFAGTGYEALEDGPPLEAAFSQPSDLASHNEMLYVADAETSAIRSVELGAHGTVGTLVGRGLFTFGDQDGVGDDVRMQHPLGLAYHDGMLFVADTYNNKIKRIDPAARRVETLIGTGNAGDTDGTFEEVTLYEPEGIAASDTYLFIADTNNHQIRFADLASATVRTLRISDPYSLLVSQRTTVRLDAIAVGHGPISIALHVVLPQGYKHNPDAPVTLTSPPIGGTQTFGIGEQPALTANVQRNRDIVLLLTVYPCHIDNGLCLIHDVRLVLPLVVTENGPQQVEVVYQVPELPV